MKPSDIHAVVVEFLGPDITPCGDNSCAFGSPGGMATNGGCRCVVERHPGQRIEDRQTIMTLARAVNRLAKEVVLRRASSDVDAAKQGWRENTQAHVADLRRLADARERIAALEAEVQALKPAALMTALRMHDLGDLGELP